MAAMETSDRPAPADAPASSGAGAGAGGRNARTYNYVASASAPSACLSSLLAHFTSQNEQNLIVNKCTRLQIYRIRDAGIELVHDIPVYGRIAQMERIRRPGDAVDRLFISTEKHKFAVLRYDPNLKRIETLSNGDLHEVSGRPCDLGQVVLVDPDCRMIGVHIYDGLFKVLPFDMRTGHLAREMFNVRLEELMVIDMCFLYGMPVPTLCVLYEDLNSPTSARHLRSYQILLGQKDVEDGALPPQPNLDWGAHMLLPIPAPLGGVLIVGQQTLTYYNVQGHVSIPMPSPPPVIKAAERIESRDGAPTYRWLLGDHRGGLHVLQIDTDETGRAAAQLRLTKMGTTVIPSSLTYLDNRVVFVGSTFGDPQLVRLMPRTDAQGSCIEILECKDLQPNIGPIVDLCVMDLDRQGQCQVVTCSGGFKEGSLRVITNGIGITEEASVEMPGVRGMWALRGGLGKWQRLMVLSFPSESRVLELIGMELGESDAIGLVRSEPTLWCGDADGGQVVQVTPSGIVLLRGGDDGVLVQTRSWAPPAGKQVSLAAGSGSLVLVALAGGKLVLLRVGRDEITECAQATVTNGGSPCEVSCIDMSPLGPGEPAIAAVGTWTDFAVRVFTLPTMHEVHAESLPEADRVVPRSLLLVTLEDVAYCLCALGDGSMFSFLLDPASGRLSGARKMVMGTQPVALRMFTTRGTTSVFAASDRPTVIYSNNKKLLFSNVNLGEAANMCVFNTEAFPNSFAFSVEGKLLIGTIDEIQKLHIQKVALNEMPRRIAHMSSTRTLCVLTIEYGWDANAGDDVEISQTVRLFNDLTFEQNDSYKLDQCELPQSVCACCFEDSPEQFFAVGTAYADQCEAEPTRGRILLFRVVEGRLILVGQKATKGAVFSMRPFAGKLLCSINSKVQLFRRNVGQGGEQELSAEAMQHGHILALYLATRGDFVLVGDLMRSASLLRYRPEDSQMEELARDWEPNWLVSLEFLDDDTFLLAENNYNLITLQKNAEAASEEERGRLDVVGEYHLGEMVNAMRHGSLVMSPPEAGGVRSAPTVIFGTINGVIGIIASLPQAEYEYFLRVQDAMTHVVHGIGGFDHRTWRSFSNERKTRDPRNFIDGDLIESFLELPSSFQQQVCDVMSGVTVQELTHKIEEMSRLH